MGDSVAKLKQVGVEAAPVAEVAAVGVPAAEVAAVGVPAAEVGLRLLVLIQTALTNCKPTC